MRTRHKGEASLTIVELAAYLRRVCHARGEQSSCSVPGRGNREAGVRYDALKTIRSSYDSAMTYLRKSKSSCRSGNRAEYAHISTLDIHIGLLRNWIVGEGISLLEIPPSPAGYSFAVCLTHDIDFVGIREHKLDHTMGGFLYRSTVGAVLNCLSSSVFRCAISLRRWVAASLPFVYLGWAGDFWIPFEWYLR